MSDGRSLSRLLALVPVVAVLCACAPEPPPWTDIGGRCPEVTVPAFAAVRHGTLQPGSSGDDVLFAYCRYGSENDPAGFTVTYTIDGDPGHERYWDRIAEKSVEAAEDEGLPFVTIPDVGVPAMAMIDEIIYVKTWSRNASVVASFGHPPSAPEPTRSQLVARAGDYAPLLRDLLTGLRHTP